jgi:hypothetical protein
LGIKHTNGIQGLTPTELEKTFGDCLSIKLFQPTKSKDWN